MAQKAIYYARKYQNPPENEPWQWKNNKFENVPFGKLT